MANVASHAASVPGRVVVGRYPAESSRPSEGGTKLETDLVEPDQEEPPFELGPTDDPPDHPNAGIWLYESDVSLLAYLLQDLRAAVRLATQGGLEIIPYKSITWEVHGLQRRTVICRTEPLFRYGDVQFVGFFGDRRDDDQDSGIDDVELDVVGQFVHYPGILAYSSIELVDRQWANLVVHESPDDREEWRKCPVHKKAVDLVSPKAYTGVRIHNGHIPGGVIGTAAPVLECTKYWDFNVDPVWRARRQLPGGATGTVRRPAAGAGE